MRNNNKKSTRKSTTLNFLRIAILAICFVLTFSFALSSDVLSFGGENGLPNGGDTASAVEYGDVLGHGAKGGAMPVLPTTINGTPLSNFPSAAGIGENAGKSSVGWLSGTDLGFPFGTNETSKSYTLDYRGAQYTRDAVDSNGKYLPTNNVSTSWQNANGTASGAYFNFTDADDNNGFWFNTKGDCRANAVINFEMPEVFRNLLQSPCFKISYSGEFKVKNKNTTGNNPWAYPKYMMIKSPYPVLSEDSNYTHCTADGDGTNTGYTNTDINTGNWQTWTPSGEFDSNNTNLAIAFDWGRKISGVNGGEQAFDVKNIQFTYTVTYNPNPTDKLGNPIEPTVNDGVAPAFAGYDKANNATAPIRTTQNQDQNWPTFFNNESFKGMLKTDVLDDINGNTSMISFVNKKVPLGKYQNTDYYKSLAMNFKDGYNFDKNTNNQNAPNKFDTLNEVNQGITGIKTIDLGIVRNDTGAYIADAAHFDMHSLGYNVATTKSIYVDDPNSNAPKQVGLMEVTRVNNATATIKMYFFDNAPSMTLTVKDNGLTTSKKINVQGIDGINPAAPTLETFEKFMLEAKDTNNLVWYMQQLLNNDAYANDDNEDPSTGYAPYVWFYTVEKGDSIDKLKTATYAYQSQMDALTNGNTGNLIPFAYKGLNINFDFKTGKMATPVDKIGVGNPDGNDCSGAGYYRFTFRALDCANNASALMTYYAKVDYEKPTYTTDVSFKNPYSGSTVNIIKPTGAQSSDIVNGAWANSELFVTLTFDRIAISGSHLLFTTPDGNEHTLVLSSDGKGNLTMMQLDGQPLGAGNGVPIIEDKLGGIVISVGKNQITNKATLTFLYCSKPNEGGGGTAGDPESALTLYPVIDYFAVFQTVLGSDTMRDEQTYVEPGWTYTEGRVTSNGVVVRVDRNEPSEGTIMLSAESKITEGGINGTEIPIANRNWYTDGWDYKGLELNFAESSEYAADKNLYIGMLFGKFLDSSYLTSGGANYFKKATNFKAMFEGLGGMLLDPIPLSKFDNGGVFKDYLLKLVQNKGVGLRSIYVFTKDQAGNVSNMSSYYVLVDPTQYRLSNVVTNGTFKSGNATINNMQGEQAKLYHRGDVVEYGFDFSAGYVPYMFKVSGATAPILFNGTTASKFGYYKDTKPENMALNGNTLSITVDQVDMSKQLYPDTANAVSYELSYRKIVNINITNNTAEYNGGEAVDISMVITGQDKKIDEAPRKGIKVSYFNVKVDGSVGEEMLNEPRTPSAEGFYIGIALDPTNAAVFDNYVLDAQTDAKIKFQIINRKATVRATNAQGEYGDDHANYLAKAFTIDGLSAADALLHQNGGLTIGGGDNNGRFLKLNVTNPIGTYNKLDIGQYRIVEQSKITIQYYDITFVDANYTVIPRKLVVNVANTSKIYKEAESAINFTVDSARFASGQKFGDIFKNCNFGGNAGGSLITLTGADGNVILRKLAGVAIGENVGSYDYIASAEKFNLNSNYELIFNFTGKYTINPATVEYTVKSGQTTVINGITTNDDKGNPLTSLSKQDEDSILNILNNTYIQYIVANDYLSDIKGALSIGVMNSEDKDSDKDFIIRKYKITSTFTGLPNVNLTSTNVNTVEFIVKIQKSGSTKIVVSMINGHEFEKTFGQLWNMKTDGEFSRDMFNVTGLGVYSDPNWSNQYRITWDTLALDSAEYVGVGIYYANIDPATIKVEEFNNTTKLWVEKVKTTYTIEVVPLVVNYAPCVIEVKPTTTAISRVYGATDADKSYGIGFDVVYPVGFPDTLKIDKANVKGNFVRGKYNFDGTFMSFGTRFDMATDANGNVLDKSGFYAIAVGTDFVTNNTNFNLVVDKNAIKNTKLAISPAKIYMQESNLKGKNKNYDGNNTVFYNDGEAYDITKILLRANDDVKLAFTAKYQSVLAGVANKIVFTKIYLEGSASMNYVLYVGDEATGVLVNFDTTTFTIAKLNNSIADATDGNLIKILKVATINLKKSDISVTKEYDTTTLLDKDSVRIASSSELSSIPAANKKLVGTYSYPQADVLKSFSIATLKVFFQIPNPSSSWTLPTTFDNDISLSFIDGPGESPEEGILLIVSNVAGSITPKVIRPEREVKSISAVNREYDATNVVEILCQLNDTAIYGNDSANGVKLTLTGKAQDPNAGEVVSGVVKKTGVDFATAVFTRPNGKAFDNYTANLADFNAYYAGANKLKVAISKVTIMPYIVLMNKQYDGESKATAANTANENGIVAVNPTTNALNTELSNLTYILTGLTYSNNKVAYAGVQFDLKGNVRKHDVLVAGLVITDKSNGSIATKFANYDLLGTNGNKGITYQNNVATVADFELPEIAVLSQKIITPVKENITVKNKIYDGTENVNVSIAFEAGDFIGNEATEVKAVFNARFDGANVAYTGDKVAEKNVAISDQRLVDSNSIPPYTTNVSKNYFLNSLSLTAKATIYPAPLMFNTSADNKSGSTTGINLGEKTYNQKVDSTVSNIKYALQTRTSPIDMTTPGVIFNDTSATGVLFGSAAYKNKNVKVDATGNVLPADANVYDLSVIGNSVNYQLVVSSATKLTSRVDKDIVAVEFGGRFELYKNLTVDEQSRATMYYYSLPKATYYVQKDKYVEMTHGAIIGSYMVEISGKPVECYLLNDTAAGVADVVDLGKKAVNYLDATGTVNPRNIYVPVAKKVNQSANPYTKPFDGTTTFSGVRDTDFVIDDINVSGLYAGDIITLDEVIGAFISSYAGLTNVKFTVKTLGGADKDNYRVDNSTSMLSGRIEKLNIKAELQNHNVEYGFNSAAQVYDKINYTIAGQDAIGTEFVASLKKVGAKLYMTHDDYVKMFPTAKIATTYNYNDKTGAMDVVVGATPGAYVALTGNFSFPVGVPEQGVSSLSQASKPNEHYRLYLVDGSGVTSNYKFAPVYTIDDQSAQNDDHSKLTIDKATLYVYASSPNIVKNADGSSYYVFNRFYGEADPAIAINYCDAAGNYGFRNSDTEYSVFGANKAKYSYGLWNGTAFGDVVAANSLISKDLAIGQFYSVLFNLTDINAGTANYKVALRYNVDKAFTGTPDEQAAEKAKVVAQLPRLEIALPTINESAATAEKVAVSNKSVVYTSNSLERAIFTSGLLDADINNLQATGLGVYFEFSKNTGTDAIPVWAAIEGYPTEVGSYKATLVKLTRNHPLAKADGNFYQMTFEQKDILLTITKATLGMKADMWSALYNKDQSKSFEKSFIEFAFAAKTPEGYPVGLTENDITVKITYNKQIVSNAMKHAGSYSIDLIYAGNNNYMAETGNTVYTIAPLIIDVKVDNSLQSFVSEEKTNVKFEYRWHKDMDNTLALPTLQLRYLGKINDEGVQSYITVKGPGTYTYQIAVLESTDGVSELQDYALKGAIGGLFTVGSVALSSKDKEASLVTKDNTIILATAIAYQEIFSNTNNYGDAEYWKTINNYMPIVGGGQNAALKSVVKLQVQYNGHKVESGTVKMKVAVPSSVGSMDDIVVYAVTKDGGLQKVDYVYENGFITYETDNVDSIAFIKLGGGLPAWAIAIIAIVSLLAVAGVVCGGVFGGKAKKAKKLALANGGVTNAKADKAQNAKADKAPKANVGDNHIAETNAKVESNHMAEAEQNADSKKE